MASEQKVVWLPLESNPDVMNKFIRNLGVPASWQLVDVLGLDPELLQMVPQPVLAVVLLFPVNENYEESCRNILREEASKKGAGSKFEYEEYSKKVQEENEKKVIGSGVYFLRQTISNACGTVALIHALGNNQERIQLDDEKSLKKFLDGTKDLSPLDRGKMLEINEDICSAHKEHAQEGQTSAPNPDEPVNLHFVTLVNVDNVLYELDGRKDIAIGHGPTTEGTFLDDAAKVCKNFMERDPSEVHFSVVALAAAQGDN